MKLTDTYKLRDYVKEQINPYGKPFDGSSYEFGLKIMHYIDNTSTDYDVDKVVKELEELRKVDMCESGDCPYEDTLCCDCTQYRMLDRTIEIVKHGCVSDDVCEWKYSKEIMDNAEFKVGCNPNALKRGIVPNNFAYHNFIYCPYCGKKIKVVK